MSCPEFPQPWTTTPQELLAGALIAVSVLLLPCCDRPPSAKLITAEFQDENIPDGAVQHGESVRITLSEPLPENFQLDSVRIETYPAAMTSWTVELTSHPRHLQLIIQTSPPDLQLHGVFGTDSKASGLGVDLGGGLMWVDLQAKASLPILERIVWVDSPPGAGNLAVDEGDWLRLIFDRPVKLAPGASGAPVETPSEIILSKANDRLDDGERPARFANGERPEEVLIVLGARPILEVGGEFTGEIGAVERFLPSAPSGLALNGSSVFPLARITDARGGTGSVSNRELDIEFASDFPVPRRQSVGPPDAPHAHMRHTVTPLGWLALLAGGRTVENEQQDPRPVDEVLLFDPFRARAGKPAFTSAAQSLPEPVFDHTATALPGVDGIVGTQDDLVIIIGGEDGSNETARMAAVRLRRSGALENLEVIALQEELWVPRSGHAAVAVSAHEILVDGGFRPSEDRLVETAELLRFREDDAGVNVTRHTVFRTLARRHHTLTLLPTTTNGETYVLGYGGFGRDRRRHPHPAAWFGRPIDHNEATKALFAYHQGSVLISPLLINVRSPARSITKLPYDFSFSLLRARHAAAPLQAKASPVAGLPTASTVLLAGGTSSHPRYGFDGGLKLWEMPIRVDLPQGHETADVILVHFDSERPARTRIEVVPHPAPDPDELTERVFFSATAVPGYGVLVAGGEPDVKGDKVRLRSIEVFLSATRRLTRLAGALPIPIAGHQGYVVAHEDLHSIFLLGGISETNRAADGVIEIPLTPR